MKSKVDRVRLKVIILSKRGYKYAIRFVAIQESIQMLL